MPRESLNIKAVIEGMNTSNSPQDIKDTECSKMVNMSPSKNGNLQVSNQFRLLQFPYFLTHSQLDETSESDLSTKLNDYHLVPGWGCGSFRTDYCIVAPFANDPLFSISGNYDYVSMNQDSVFMQSGKEYGGRGYYCLVVPAIRLVSGAEGLKLKSYLTIFQSNYVLDEAMSRMSWYEALKLLAVSIEDENFNFLSENPEKLQTFFRAGIVTHLSTAFVGESWFQSSSKSMNSILYEMVEKLPEFIPSLKYLYTDQMLRVTDSNFNYEPRIFSFGKKIIKYWWTGSSLSTPAYQDYQQQNAYTENKEAIQEFAYLYTRPLDIKLPDNARITSSLDPTWAFSHSIDSEGVFRPQGITEGNWVDVVFKDATEGIVVEEGESYSGKIWNKNTMNYVFKLGISFLEMTYLKPP